MVDISSLMLVLAEPFMQRALVGGLLTGALGGVLGSVAVLRQLSFFSDALGHSALLGITLGILIGVNPTLVLIPFAILFAITFHELLINFNILKYLIVLFLVKTFSNNLNELLLSNTDCWDNLCTRSFKTLLTKKGNPRKKRVIRPN